MPRHPNKLDQVVYACVLLSILGAVALYALETYFIATPDSMEQINYIASAVILATLLLGMLYLSIRYIGESQGIKTFWPAARFVGMKVGLYLLLPALVITAVLVAYAHFVAGTL